MPDSQSVEGLPAQAPENPSAKYPTRELGRLLSFYKKNVKDYGTKVPHGVMKNIQSILDKGVELEDIVTALHNYAEARRDKDPQYTMGVRSFFSEAKIREWLNPVKAAPPQKPSLPQIDFQPLTRPAPAVPLLDIAEEEEYEL